MKNLKLQVTLQ